MSLSSLQSPRRAAAEKRDGLLAQAYDLARPTSSFDAVEEEDDAATKARKALLRRQQQAKQLDQARLHEFLRALVWGGASPAATTHRKMILLLDDNCDQYKTREQFVQQSLAVRCLQDFVGAQRGRLSLQFWYELLSAAPTQQQIQQRGSSSNNSSSITAADADGVEIDEEVLMQRVEHLLGPTKSVWFVVPAGGNSSHKNLLASHRLLRCIALHLLVGRLHPNTRLFLVISRNHLQHKIDDLSVFPTVARHACTTSIVTRLTEKRKKLFAVGDLSRLAIVAIPDKWSRDLLRTSTQQRDEYGNSVLAMDAITTEGVALIEDVLTSADTVPTVRFHPRYGNGAAFARGVASGLRFNYVTHTIDLTGSICGSDPMSEFGPSLRASRKLTTMIVSQCHLTDQGLIDLAAAVRECSNMTSLDVSGNTLITTDGIVALAMALAIEDPLPLLLLSSTTAGGALRGGAGDPSSSSSSDADFHHMPSSSSSSAAGARSLLSSIPGYTNAPACKLQRLSIAGCNSICSSRTVWTSDGIRLFFRYLGRCTALRHLDLSNNSFTEADAMACATYCVPPPKNYGTTVVEASQLYSQQQQEQHADGNKGAAAPVTAASLLSSFGADLSAKKRIIGLQLESLNLSGNGIGDAGAAIIATRLASTLKRIDLSHCGLSARAFIYCGLCISRHPELREINLSYNDLSWERAMRVRRNEQKVRQELLQPALVLSPASLPVTAPTGAAAAAATTKRRQQQQHQDALEKWLKADGGLREALENLPASLALSSLDVVPSAASASGASNTGGEHDDDEEEQRRTRGLGGSLDGNYNYDRTVQQNDPDAKLLRSKMKRDAEHERQRAKHVRGFGSGTSSQDESQFCWFTDRFLQFVYSVSDQQQQQQRQQQQSKYQMSSSSKQQQQQQQQQQQLTLILDISHCVLATATVRTLLEGGVLRGLVSFESLCLSGNYGVRGETVSLLMGEVAGHPKHSQCLRRLEIDDVDPEVRERAMIGVFLAASSAFDSGKDAAEERSRVTGQVIAKKEKERHRAQLEVLSCRGPELTDGMLYSIRTCPVEMLPPLRSLDLSRMTLLASGAETIATVAARLPSLQRLVVRGIWEQFFSPDIQKVVSLDTSPKHGLPIMRHFADLIMDSKSIKFLDLSENGVGTTAARCLLGALKESSKGDVDGKFRHDLSLDKLLLTKNAATDWKTLETEFSVLFDSRNPKVLY